MEKRYLIKHLTGLRRDLRPDHFREADISVLILGEANKSQKRRQSRINYELIWSEILLLTVDRRGSIVRNADFTATCLISYVYE